MASHGIAWHRMASHGIASRRMASHGVAWRRMASHASRRIGSYRTPSPVTPLPESIPSPTLKPHPTCGQENPVNVDDDDEPVQQIEAHPGPETVVKEGFLWKEVRLEPRPYHRLGQ